MKMRPGNNQIWEDILAELSTALEPLVGAAFEEPAGSGIIRIAQEVGYELTGQVDPGVAKVFCKSNSKTVKVMNNIIFDHILYY